MYYRYPTTLIEDSESGYCIENLYANDIIKEDNTYSKITNMGNFNFKIKIKNTVNNTSKYISFFTLPSNCSSVYILESNMNSAYIRYMFQPFYYSNAISFKKINSKFIEVYDNLYVYPFEEDYFLFKKANYSYDSIEYGDSYNSPLLKLYSIDPDSVFNYSSIAYHKDIPYSILYNYDSKEVESILHELKKYKNPILYICLENEHYKFDDYRLKVKIVYSFKSIRTNNNLDILIIDSI